MDRKLRPRRDTIAWQKDRLRPPATRFHCLLSVAVVEWSFACAGFGIAVDSSSLVIGSFAFGSLPFGVCSADGCFSAESEDGAVAAVCDGVWSTASALGGITGAGLAGGGAITGVVGVSSGFTDADRSADRSQAATPKAMAIAASKSGICARFTAVRRT
jgi:hypothetical protein